MSSADESTQTLREHRPLLYPAPLRLPVVCFPPALSRSIPHVSSPVTAESAFPFPHLLLSHLFFALFSVSLYLRVLQVTQFISAPLCPCTTVEHQSLVSCWATCCPAPQSEQITVDILKGTGSNGPQWAGYVEAPFVQ